VPLRWLRQRHWSLRLRPAAAIAAATLLRFSDDYDTCHATIWAFFDADFLFQRHAATPLLTPCHWYAIRLSAATPMPWCRCYDAAERYFMLYNISPLAFIDADSCAGYFLPMMLSIFRCLFSPALSLVVIAVSCRMPLMRYWWHFRFFTPMPCHVLRFSLMLIARQLRLMMLITPRHYAFFFL